MSPADLLGTWYVVRTNFPMWLKGDRLAPTFFYEPGANPGQLRDAVRYRTRSGATREILGTETQDPQDPSHFTWRGRGWLWLLSSEWYVLRQEGGLLGLYFSPTPFTPAGMDVIAREPSPDPAAVEDFVRALGELPGMREQAATLVAPAGAPTLAG